MEPFGRRASGLSDQGTLFELEADAGKAELFVDVDALVSTVLLRALAGETTVKVERGRQTDSISFLGLDPRLQHVLDDLFAVANQHSRGAWFIPEKASLKSGLVNLPSTFARHPRFATGLAWEERARVILVKSPPGVFVWALLEPLLEQLFLPFELRGRSVGSKSREDQLAAWASIDELVSAMQFDVEDELAVMRYGGGWSQLRAAPQLEAKQRLLAAFAAQADEVMAARYRTYRLSALMTRYYSKAKEGRARRKQVLTRPLERTLAGFFGGDWLRFLQYLGEDPHPDEEIAAAIPETKLFVGSTKSSTLVATQLGVPAEEVERALSTYWETTGERPSGSASPIDERVGTLKTLWAQFDAIHSRQVPGMPSLWGLVEEDRSVRIGWEGPDWYNPRLYRTLLPNDLVSEIERLWAGAMLSKWPDRIVSEISPHALMAEAFGAALRFWHGTSLTAWFVCEGPTSRTDMAGLARYHQDALGDLERLRCPIDPLLFEELREAETLLGSPEPLKQSKSSVEVAPGMRIEFSTSMGSRRSGFERLRDIITRYRQAWAGEYLDPYLRARWEMEIREAARLHSQAIAARGKPPTARQFARHAVEATNHWFCGDLSAFYAAIGEKSPVQTVRVSLMPADRLGFAKQVFAYLGGRPIEAKVMVANREEGQAQAEEQGRQNKLGWLAGESLRFIQLEEALGRPPEMKEFSASGFEYRSEVLSPELPQAWEIYRAGIDFVRHTSAEESPQTVTTHKAAAAAAPSSERSAAPQIPSPPTPLDQREVESGRRSWLDRWRGR